jgi:hypothetical protein
MGVNDVSQAKIAEIMALAEATPRRLATSTAGFDDAALSQRPSAEEWSPLEILNHLRACEEVWMHGVHLMLVQETPTLHEIHPREWIKAPPNPYTRVSFSQGLRIFTLRREALLITLGALSLEDWRREGRIAGKTHTVFSQVRRMVLHEDEHCDEIEALLKRE